MTSLTVGRIRIVCNIIISKAAIKTPTHSTSTYMFKLGRVRALLINQWRVRLDNTGANQMVQLLHTC